MKKYFALMALAFGSTGVAANEFVVTPSLSKSGSTFSIDYVSNGDVVGIQYNFALPKGVSPEQVNLKSCAADLPKGIDGGCSVAKGQIIGYAINDSGVPFPAGILSIGTISITGVDVKSLDVVKLVAADKDAQEVSVNASFGDASIQE